MTEAPGWHVDVLVDDVTTGEQTRARARLRTPDGTTLVGVGEAPRGPAGDGGALAVSHALSDLTSQLSPAASDRRPRPALRRRLAELAGYAGGGLMFGGAALLVATSWTELARPGRIALLNVATAGRTGTVAGPGDAGRRTPRAGRPAGRGTRPARPRSRLATGLGADTDQSHTGPRAFDQRTDHGHRRPAPLPHRRLRDASLVVRKTG